MVSKRTPSRRSVKWVVNYDNVHFWPICHQILGQIRVFSVIWSEHWNLWSISITIKVILILLPYSVLLPSWKYTCQLSKLPRLYTKLFPENCTVVSPSQNISGPGKQALVVLEWELIVNLLFISCSTVMSLSVSQLFFSHSNSEINLTLSEINQR